MLDLFPLQLAALKVTRLMSTWRMWPPLTPATSASATTETLSVPRGCVQTHQAPCQRAAGRSGLKASVALPLNALKLRSKSRKRQRGQWKSQWVRRCPHQGNQNPWREGSLFQSWGYKPPPLLQHQKRRSQALMQLRRPPKVKMWVKQLHPGVNPTW